MTSTSSIDPLLSILPSHPPNQETTASIFDLLLIDRFSGLFKPAFDHLFNQYLLPNFPILRLFASYREELWILLYASIQDQYLRSSSLLVNNNTNTRIGGALLEESLYGWHRKYYNVGKDSSSSRSSSNKINKPSFMSKLLPSSVSTRIGITIFLHILLPYIRLRTREWSLRRQEQCRQRYEQWETRYGTSSSSSSTTGLDTTTIPIPSPSSLSHRNHPSVSSIPSPPPLSLSDYFAKYYPYLHSGYDLLNILYLINYSLGLSKYSNITNHINQIQLVCGINNNNNSLNTKDNPMKKRIPSVWEIFKRTVQLSIIMTLMMLQLYYWWSLHQQSSSSSRNNSSSLTNNWKLVPPPPLPPLGTLSLNSIQSTDDTMNTSVPGNTSSATVGNPTIPTVPNVKEGCPLCGKSTPTNPIVLMNGYVYCETCLAENNLCDNPEIKRIKLREA